MIRRFTLVLKKWQKYFVNYVAVISNNNTNEDEINRNPNITFLCM